MTRARRKETLLTPRLPKPKTVVKSLRMTEELYRKIERHRGEVDFSRWACSRLEAAVESPEEHAVRYIKGLMRQMGVKLEQLKDGDE